MAKIAKTVKNNTTPCVSRPSPTSNNRPIYPGTLTRLEKAVEKFENTVAKLENKSTELENKIILLQKIIQRQEIIILKSKIKKRSRRINARNITSHQMKKPGESRNQSILKIVNFIVNGDYHHQ